jgi:hypothetical protein
MDEVVDFHISFPRLSVVRRNANEFDRYAHGYLRDDIRPVIKECVSKWQKEMESNAVDTERMLSVFMTQSPFRRTHGAALPDSSHEAALARQYIHEPRQDGGLLQSRHKGYGSSMHSPQSGNVITRIIESRDTHEIKQSSHFLHNASMQ